MKIDLDFKENDDFIDTPTKYESETSTELLTDNRSRLINDNAIYETTNQYDIPQLRDDMLCDKIPDFTLY